MYLAFVKLRLSTCKLHHNSQVYWPWVKTSPVFAGGAGRQYQNSDYTQLQQEVNTSLHQPNVSVIAIIRIIKNVSYRSCIAPMCQYIRSKAVWQHHHFGFTCIAFVANLLDRVTPAFMMRSITRSSTSVFKKQLTDDRLPECLGQCFLPCSIAGTSLRLDQQSMDQPFRIVVFIEN